MYSAEARQGEASSRRKTDPDRDGERDIPLYYFPFDPNILFLPEVQALRSKGRDRLMILLALASTSRTRWVIQNTDETLQHALGFSSDVHLARFLQRLVDEALIYVTEEGFYIPSHRLLRFVDDYPQLPTHRESIKNFIATAGGSLEAQTVRQGTPNATQRQAVKRGWAQLADLVRSRGVELPLDRHQKLSHPLYERFRLLFLRHYTGGVSPQEIPGLIVDTLFPTANSMGNSHAEDEDVTPNERDIKRDMDANSPRDSEPVTPRVEDTLEIKTQTQSHNNNTNTTPESRPESRETDPQCHAKNGVTSQVTDEKAVVVEMLTHQGEVWEEDAEAAAKWLSEAEARIYLFWMDHIQPKPANKGAFLAELLQHRRPVPGDIRAQFEQEAKRQAKKAVEAAQQRSRAEVQQRQSEQLQACWRQMTEAERLQLVEEASNRLTGIHRDRWKEYRSNKRPMTEFMEVAIDARIEEILRERESLPPLDKENKIPPRLADLMSLLEAALPPEAEESEHET